MDILTPPSRSDNPPWGQIYNFKHRRGIGWCTDRSTGDIYLFGGRTGDYSDGSSYLNDLIRYDPGIGEWEEMPNGRAGPADRGYAYMAFDPVMEKLYLYSGILTADHRYQDLWEYDVQESEWTLLVEDFGLRTEIGFYKGCVYGFPWISIGTGLARYDTNTGEVDELVPTGGIVSRRFYGTTFDPINGKFFIFGGSEFHGQWDFYNDLDELDIDTVSWNHHDDLPDDGRQGTDIAYDPQGNAIYLYGGAEDNVNIDDNSEDDVWKYDITTRSWIKLYDACEPGNMYLHRVELDPVRKVLYMYCENINNYRDYEFWELSINTGSWDRYDERSWPPYLRDQSLASINGDLYLFGGYDIEKEGVFRSHLKYDASKGSWTNITSPLGPPFRWSVYTAVDILEKRIFLYSGRDGDFIYNDIWCYDIEDNEWTDLTEGTFCPFYLYGDMVYSYVDDSLYLFGGIHYTGLLSNELWRFDIKDQEWSLVKRGGPGERENVTMEYDFYTESLYVFGGKGSSVHNDLWKYTIKTDGWMEVLINGAKPQARWKHRSEYHPYTNQFMIYGGVPASSELLEDTWLFSFSNSSWHKIDPGNSPGKRMGQSLSFDPSSARFYLFGGKDDDWNIFYLDFLGSGIKITTEVDKINITEGEYLYQTFEAVGYPILTWEIQTEADWLFWDRPNSSLIGTPGGDDIGVTSVDVIVRNPYGWTDSKIITIHVANEPPVILNEFEEMVYEDEPYYVDCNSTDDEGPITWHLEGNANWLSINSVTGILSGTPTNDEVGSYKVNVGVDDGYGWWDWLNYTLIVVNVNDDPTIITDSLPDAYEDEPFEFHLEGFDIDPGAQNLNWACLTAAPFVEFDSAEGVISGTPRQIDVGDYELEIFLSDLWGGISTKVLNLEVINTNDPPIQNKDLDSYSVLEDTPAYYIPTDDLFTDSDGDILDLSVMPCKNLSVSLLENSSLEVIPDKDWCGTENITLIANDTITEKAGILKIEVIPVNDRPHSVQIQLLQGSYVEGMEQMVSGSAVDPDIIYGDSLTFIWSSNLSGRIGTGRTINLSLPAGEHILNLTVKDAGGLTSSIEIPLTVELNTNGDDGDGGNGSSGGKVGSIIVIIIVVVLFVLVVIAVSLFLAMRKRRKGTEIQGTEGEIKKDAGTNEAMEGSTVMDGNGPPPANEIQGWYKEVPPLTAPSVGETTGSPNHSWESANQGDQ